MTERARVFGGAKLAAVYLPHEETGELRLMESAGGPAARHGLPLRLPPGDTHPVAECFRTRRARWPVAEPGKREGGERDGGMREGGVWEGGVRDGSAALAVLPLRSETGVLGVLALVGARGVALGDAAGAAAEPDREGERRVLYELYAEHVAERLETRGEPHPWSPSGRALEARGLGWFSLSQTTGRAEADAAALELAGVAPRTFDERVESLLANAVPEDLPALMALVEPGPMASGGRQFEFRVRLASGELRWLHLRCRVPAGVASRPGRVLGLLADAAHLRPGADEVSRVQRLSATLATAVTVRDVSDVALAALRELGADRIALASMEGDRLAVTALEPAESEAWPAPWRATWPDAPTRALPTLSAALREGRTTLWAEGTALEPGLAGIGPGGVAVLPLLADARVVGACLAGWHEPHEFRTEERFLLAATAGLVGHAMVRARAFDAQHELAEMLQRSLLPRTLPVLPGGVAVARYLPATVGLDVGGDWYDVIPLTDRHVAFVIGDVQGHSAAAATIMGQIRTAIRAYAVEGHSPDVVLSHANRLLVGMETDLFATCCYVAMDMEEGDTWFVRAGHPPPLVRDPDGGTREVDIEGGPPLGVLAEAAFPMTTLSLLPGTVLALLTDGLVESSSLPVEDGLARIRAILGATDPGEPGLLADALLGGANRRDDDVALLLLRYDGMRVRPRRAGWEVWRLPDAVGHARRFTARTLRAWQVSGGADIVLLVVSELVTNALMHTQGQVRLDLTLAGDRLRVAVSDSSPRTPVRQENVDWEATGGRGILLVASVSAAWGSVPLSGGKQVWGEIAVARDGTGGEVGGHRPRRGWGRESLQEMTG